MTNVVKTALDAESMHKCQVQITMEIPGPWWTRACNTVATTNYSVLMTPKQTARLGQRRFNAYGEGWGLHASHLAL